MPEPILPSSRTFLTRLINSLPPPSADAHAHATVHDAQPSINPLDSVPEAAKKQLLTLHVFFPNELLPALDLLDRRLVTRFRVCDAAPSQTAPPKASSPQLLKAVDIAQAPAEVRGSSGDASSARQDDAGNAADMSAPNAGSGSGGIGSADAEMTDPELSCPRADQPRSADLLEGSRAYHHGDAKGNGNTVYYVRSAQQRSSRYSTSYDNTTNYEVRLQAWNCSCPAFAFAAFPNVQSEFDGSGFTEGDMEEEEGLSWVFGGVSLGGGVPPVCKHLLACVLGERCGLFAGAVEEKRVSVEEAAGWAAGWGD